METLKFSFGNRKMLALSEHLEINKREVVAFDLPAGWTCPKADICKTHTDRVTGKMTKSGRFTCYAAKGETYATNVRKNRWHNFDLLKACAGDVDEIVKLITESLPKNVQYVRIHASGDFYRPEYYHAWVLVAIQNPDIEFFAYTKDILYAMSDRPDNFNVQYSYGSIDDKTWDVLEVKPPTCFVGESDNQYPNIRIVCGTHETAHEDFYAIRNHETFVIGVH